MCLNQRRIRLITAKLECIKMKLKLASCLGLDRVGLGGGLAFFWKEGVDVRLALCSLGHIDVNVCLVDKDGFCLTNFYDNLETSLINHSRELFKKLKKHTSETWIIYGDFNEIKVWMKN